MVKTEPTLQELIDGAIAVYEKDSGHKIKNKKGFNYVILTATAGLAKLCLKWGMKIFRNNFVHSADAEGLANFAKEYGVDLKPATQAHLKVEVSEAEVAVIPVSTEFSKDRHKFVSTNVEDVVDKKAIVPVVAKNSGFIRNLQVGMPLNIETQFGINQKAKVVEILNSGTDQETLEEFRLRLLNIIRNKGSAGSQPYYIQHTLKIYGVQEAFVYRGQEMFQVGIFPLFVDGSGNRRNSTKQEKERIADYFKNPSIFIIGDYISILDFKVVKIKVKITGLSPSTHTIKERLKKAIKSFVESRRPLQHQLQRERINSISSIDLYELMAREGSRNAQISFQVDDQDSQLYVLKAPVGTIQDLANIYVQPEIANLEEVSFA